MGRGLFRTLVWVFGTLVSALTAPLIEHHHSLIPIIRPCLGETGFFGSSCFYAHMGLALFLMSVGSFQALCTALGVLFIEPYN